MKTTFRYYIVIIALLSVISSCRSNNEKQNQDSLVAERDSLINLSNQKQKEIESMTAFFNDLASCIDSITENEKLLIVSKDKETGRAYSSQEIKNRLERLSEVITSQRIRIYNLVDSLRNRVDTTRIKGLENMVKYLTSQLEAKEQQISSLKGEINNSRTVMKQLNSRLNSLTEDVSALTEQNSKLTSAIKKQNEIINEGYVLIASKETLKEMGIIEKGNIFKSGKVNLGNVSLSKCNKVNITVLRELPIPSRKMKILSPIPKDSYTLTSSGNTSTIKIKDVSSFWSLSNILVVQI